MLFCFKFPWDSNSVFFCSPRHDIWLYFPVSLFCTVFSTGNLLALGPLGHLCSWTILTSLMSILLIYGREEELCAWLNHWDSIDFGGTCSGTVQKMFAYFQVMIRCLLRRNEDRNEGDAWDFKRNGKVFVFRVHDRRGEL